MRKRLSSRLNFNLGEVRNVRKWIFYQSQPQLDMCRILPLCSNGPRTPSLTSAISDKAMTNLKADCKLPINQKRYLNSSSYTFVFVASSAFPSYVRRSLLHISSRGMFGFFSRPRIKVFRNSTSSSCIVYHNGFFGKIALSN